MLSQCIFKKSIYFKREACLPFKLRINFLEGIYAHFSAMAPAYRIPIFPRGCQRADGSGGIAAFARSGSGPPGCRLPAAEKERRTEIGNQTGIAAAFRNRRSGRLRLRRGEAAKDQCGAPELD